MPAKAARVIPFRKKIHSLSFFSGAMGLDLGLEAEGIEPLMVSEIDKSCIATIRSNKPDLKVIGDIREYTPAQIRQISGLAPNDEIDLVVGGPPCQPFSTAGKRLSFEDIRGNVFLNFIELITQLKPKLAVIENVRGLLSAPLVHRPHQQRGDGFAPLTPEEIPGGALWFALNMLRNAKYGISFNLYNAANFGAPQKRERVILIASRDGASLPYLEPTHSQDGQLGLPKWRTVRQAIGRLKNKEHDFVKFPEKRLKYYRLIKAGQYWKHLPEHLQKEALGASFYAGGGKTGFLRRLPWDEASPTLVTHPAMPATDLAHPEEDRPLSIQEYKKLQEFPDNWHIEGKLLDQYRQVGNAVPISLGRAVGRHVMKYLNNEEIVVKAEFEYSRYRLTDHISWERNYLRRIEADKQSVLFA